MPRKRGVPITCSDNIQNHGEDGIDCGGPCGPCFTIGTGEEDKVVGESPSPAIPTGAVVGAPLRDAFKKYGWIVLLAIIAVVVLNVYLRRKKSIETRNKRLKEEETKKMFDFLDDEHK